MHVLETHAMAWELWSAAEARHGTWTDASDATYVLRNWAKHAVNVAYGDFLQVNRSRLQSV